MPLILVLLIIFPKISLANVCQKEINIYEYYFINGVGNTPRNIENSQSLLTKRLSLKKQVKSLINPRNIGESQEFINILNKIKDVKTRFLFN